MKEPNWNTYIRAQAAIAHGSLTNSKRPESFVKGVYQTHLVSGRGPFVVDVEGHQLYDFICGMGSTLLGHGNHDIANAIFQRAVQGITLSLGSKLEVELAEKIKEIIPWVQKVRFLKTGTEACMAAVKIARACTGRRRILSEGYHGWSDEFVSLSPPALGCHTIPQTSKLSSFDDITKEIAAVIVEPVMTDTSELRIAWLRKLRAKCDEVGALLIFDEIITGFRVPHWTYSQSIGVEPDIICLGKAMGGGLPISCVAGKDHVMECGEYFVSSTFAGETCSMAASLKMIELLQSKKFDINDLWEQGQRFKDRFNALYPEHIKLVGYPTRSTFEGVLLTKALLWQEAYKAGILFGASFFLSFSHGPYLDRIINVLEDIIMRIKTGSVELHGQLPKSPFAQQLRSVK